jgi:D-lactate dehydrogenase
MKDKYYKFYREIKKIIPRNRLFTDYLRRLAWGTDAGFYRMIPQIVVFPANEEEMSKILQTSYKLEVPITFRAAGTSLSGQAISNSVLVVAGKLWEKYETSENAETIMLQPGIIGERVNEILKPYGRKFSPDPASVKSAMVGGIVNNNASGMNCGIHANSDKVILSAKLIFADGTVLDTADEASRNAFAQTHKDFIDALMDLRNKVLNNIELTNKINYKYSIKNVTGLNILPLVKFSNPFDIITHLIVGSEGTLAFMANASFKTEIDLPHKASSMIYFHDIKTACRAVQIMKTKSVAGAELLDRKALRSVENKNGIPSYIKDFDDNVTAVLVEVKSNTAEGLLKNIDEVKNALSDIKTVMPVEFTDKESEYSVLWAIRAGIFPSVGGMRNLGTTTLIEDVAFHIENLPEATLDLQNIIAKHGYDEGVIYGHALEGNYHFILNQRFDEQKEVDRYENLMNDVINMVVDKYNGSLKAEHGTGRNMAPFVEREWGKDAFDVMKTIKQIFDAKNLLNPGVIFNPNERCHLENFKPLPLTNANVDKCIECGFCEINCLTSGFTLSSRQRIVVRREISRLQESGENDKLLSKLIKDYKYQGNATCAGDGLCSTSCPLEINTGHLTHDIRQELLPQGSFVWRTGNFAANHFATIKSALRPVLVMANGAHTVLGSTIMKTAGKAMHKIGVPLWTPAMPKSVKIHPRKIHQTSSNDKVVYFPSCINQTMGIAKNSPYKTPLADKMISLLQKAGYEVIFPENMEKLCCGTIWESKGMPDIADRKTLELETALYKASEQGKYPVLCDQSPCLYRMREKIKQLKLYEPVEFIETFLISRLEFTQIDEPVAVHTTCSMTKMKLKDTLKRLASRCSSQVIIPEEVGCCGFAGDKGFTRPEVNAYALRKLRPQLQKHNIKIGYSNSRTCEIGLTTNGGIPYVSIVYLVDKCTKTKNLGLIDKRNGKIVVSDYKIVTLRQKSEMAKKMLLLWFCFNH